MQPVKLVHEFATIRVCSRKPVLGTVRQPRRSQNLMEQRVATGNVRFLFPHCDGLRQFPAPGFCERGWRFDPFNEEQPSNV